MLDILTDGDGKLWDRYACEHGEAKYAHRWAWGESLARTYSLPLFRLTATDPATGRLQGILPLILFNAPGKDSRLISLPYTDAAGILADDGESSRQLLDGALDLAIQLRANHLELRQQHGRATCLQRPRLADAWSYTPHTFKTGLRRPLPPSAEQLWSTLGAKVRNQVRKARRSGCTARIGGIELLPDFYRVFSENMRDLGSPVHGVELFRNLLEGEPHQTAVIVIALHDQPVAAAFVLLHNDTLCNPWASSLRRYRPFCPNMLLYWSMLDFAVDNHCRRFDFGRSSPNAPTCRFKMQWGAEMEPLCWHVFSRKPCQWLPGNESLEYGHWKSMDLDSSRHQGPAIRRWISL